MKTIAVYLGSSFGDSSQWAAAAFGFGARAARAGIRIVYGGADAGTMKSLADGVLSEGGEIVGVFPAGFEGRAEIASTDLARKDLTELHIVRDFDERKRMMMELSDLAVVLPGSAGTMDEAFGYAVNTEIGAHDKPVWILNEGGYYDGLQRQIATMIRCGFMSAGESSRMFRFFDSMDDLFTALSSAAVL